MKRILWKQCDTLGNRIMDLNGGEERRIRWRRKITQIESVDEAIMIGRREEKGIRVRGESGESLKSFDFLQIDDGFLDFIEQIILGGIEGGAFRGVLNVDNGDKVRGLVDLGIVFLDLPCVFGLMLNLLELKETVRGIFFIF
ncbi:hypothetical protein RJT34_01647 [Clitoria ternatea]|uniref:Uncharacterized protein n=1 Tax=Clitoria ternatea TaxID=43366 RepID=A0AAN9KGF2_CLITE